jgi:hypothetical protein
MQTLMRTPFVIGLLAAGGAVVTRCANGILPMATGEDYSIVLKLWPVCEPDA